MGVHKDACCFVAHADEVFYSTAGFGLVGRGRGGKCHQLRLPASDNMDEFVAQIASRAKSGVQIFGDE